ncbi:MAG: hypothetical protein U1U88_001596 [Lawsonella clevelandensis]
MAEPSGGGGAVSGGGAAVHGAGGVCRAFPRAFALRMVMGVEIAFFCVAPLVVGPVGARHPILCSGVLQALGRWSYGIFLWHLVALWAAFQILGVPLFSGHTLGVWVVTVVVTVPLSAASYALVEEPLRRRLRAWEARRVVAASRGRGSGGTRGDSGGTQCDSGGGT